MPAGTIFPPPSAGVTEKTEPLHIVAAWFVITGEGSTVTVAVAVVEHPLAVAVMVKVVLCVVIAELLNVPVIGEPLPLKPMPLRLALLVLVQL